MELPEDIRILVSELGDGLVRVLAEDAECRKAAMRIQARGYELSLLLEAVPEEEAGSFEPDWSESDERFLHGYRIARD